MSVSAACKLKVAGQADRVKIDVPEGGLVNTQHKSLCFLSRKSVNYTQLLNPHTHNTLRTRSLRTELITNKRNSKPRTEMALVQRRRVPVLAMMMYLYVLPVVHERAFWSEDGFVSSREVK